MREYSVNGVMQESFVRRLQGRPDGDPLPPPGRRRRTGGVMSSGPAQAEPKPPLGGPGRRAVPAMLGGVAIALAAVVGLALSSSDAVAAGCAFALGLGALAIGWGFGERGMASLEAEVETSTSELKRALSELEIAQAETVQRLSMAVEFRDEDTGAHIERIGRFSVLLAEHIGMDADFCERLRHAAPLHDVGKVAIPDAILLKPGPLTPEERAIVETHAEEGHRLVRGSSSSILDMAATIALSHQEKWDGSGYPRGLKGEAIPIEGRIVAVADVFDALTSDRVYRKAFSVDEAIEMMREQRGRHFDPVLLDAFMEVLGRSGPDAREELRHDPEALVESTLETFATALERGDAEMAEGAIATAIEDGITPTTLHAEVIGPALRRLDVLSAGGELSADTEHRANTIVRRVLATLYRYMTGGTEPTRERGPARRPQGRRAHARPADGPRPARRGRVPDRLRHRPRRRAPSRAGREPQARTSSSSARPPPARTGSTPRCANSALLTRACRSSSPAPLSAAVSRVSVAACACSSASTSRSRRSKSSSPLLPLPPPSRRRRASHGASPTGGPDTLRGGAPDRRARGA